MGKTIAYTLISFITGVVMLPWILIILIPFGVILFDLIILTTLVFKLFGYTTAKAKGLRILMVDDTPTTLVVLKKVLAEKNCQLTVVDSGKIAIEQLQKNDFDLLIMDNFMLDLNGTDTLRRADEIISQKRLQKKLEKIPVIEYSSSNEDRINIVELNSFRMIGKLSKKMPSSNLRPSLTNMIDDIQSEAV
jgi:CheY-like chemotaxis protein